MNITDEWEKYKKEEGRGKGNGEDRENKGIRV